MRIVLLLALGLAVPHASLGQTTVGSGIGVIGRSVGPPPTWTIPPYGRPSRGVPPSQIGLPLPKIGLQLPRIGLQPRPGIDWKRPRLVRPERGNRHARRRAVPYPVFVFVPQPVLEVDASYAAEPAVIEEPVVNSGVLLLDVQPGSAQIFVDGFYVGTPDDLNAAYGGLELDAGPHRVEVIAPGYERVTFDVRMTPNGRIRYERRLDAIAPAPPVATGTPTLTPPTTFYLIPGCYLGNVPPQDAGLPPTCDLMRVQTFQY